MYTNHSRDVDISNRRTHGTAAFSNLSLLIRETFALDVQHCFLNSDTTLIYLYGAWLLVCYTNTI